MAQILDSPHRRQEGLETAADRAPRPKNWADVEKTGQSKSKESTTSVTTGNPKAGAPLAREKTRQCLRVPPFEPKKRNVYVVSE